MTDVSEEGTSSIYGVMRKPKKTIKKKQSILLFDPEDGSGFFLFKCQRTYVGLYRTKEIP
jgi:hypothetical protein